MQLLQDTFIVENLQVLSESKSDNKMRVKGIFGRCNEKNNNGRVYPTAVLESQLAKVQPLISERRLCGELDHPSNETVKLANASHLITKLEMKGNELIGEAEILNTPAGLTAQALIKGGVKIGISSRGMGTLSEDAQGNKIVNEDYRLVTFDLVADPSTRGAYPALSESTESRFVRETTGKLQKERNFLTMLEEKMNHAYEPFLQEAKRKLDPVGQEDADIDNDGVPNTKSDKYLRNRRKARGRAIAKKRGMSEWTRVADVLAYGLFEEEEEESSRASTLTAPDGEKKEVVKKRKISVAASADDRKGAREAADKSTGGRKNYGGAAGTDRGEGVVKGYLKSRIRSGEIRRSERELSKAKAKDKVTQAKADAKVAKIQGKADAKKAKADSKAAAKKAKADAKANDPVRQAKQEAKAAKIRAKGEARAKKIKAKAADKEKARKAKAGGKLDRENLKQKGKTGEAQKRLDRYGATTLGGIAKRKALGAVKDAKKKFDAARKNRAERKDSEAGKPKEDKRPGILSRARGAVKKFVKDRAEASVRGAERGAERAAVMRQSQSDRRRNRTEARNAVRRSRKERAARRDQESKNKQAEMASQTKRANAVKAAADARDTARRNAEASKASQERAQANKVKPTAHDTDKDKKKISDSTVYDHNGLRLDEGFIADLLNPMYFTEEQRRG